MLGHTLLYKIFKIENLEIDDMNIFFKNNYKDKFNKWGNIGDRLYSLLDHKIYRSMGH